MRAIVDLTGKRFGALIVSERSLPNNKFGHLMWRCVCDCGKEKVIAGTHLKNGDYTSCGCMRGTATKHGDAKRGEKLPRLYKIWAGMHKRCRNANCKSYMDYGGRGISVCAEWNEYAPFRDWALSHGYSHDLSIDRINNDGNYESSNCRWATRKEQNNNQRPRKKRGAY